MLDNYILFAGPFMCPYLYWILIYFCNGTRFAVISMGQHWDYGSGPDSTLT